MPQKAPTLHDLLAQMGLEALLEMMRTASDAPTTEYLHWDKLRRKTPPEGLTHETWWLCQKLRRVGQARSLPMRDKTGEPFRFVLTDSIAAAVHLLDQRAGGLMAIPGQITNSSTRDRYAIGSLIEEAITSSQLEGAATTRLIAKGMIRSGREPRDRNERMILNNYRTMQRIRELKDQPLTPDLVCDIHRLITRDALDNPNAAGRLRYADERVVVDDAYGEVFHDPPPADDLPERLELMCAFANEDTPDYFIHPALRAIMLHFWLAYDHPFVDGNGRTARAVFYWAMVRRGFWLFEYISISRILVRAPARYARAFLYTETDENDLTYFILHQLDVIEEAVRQLHEYIARKTRELKTLEMQLRGMSVLNHRQQALISHALRHPQQRYTVESHRSSHNVVYETARADLMSLTDRGLLEKRKVGRTWHFTPAPNLEGKLRDVE
ncbi:MAG: Fic family protein [Planctomycetota bacterium]